jgi:fructan beta-fructosidase
LEADMGSGSVAGGSGGEYFVGEFDGEKFTAMQTADWVDFGRDFYAPVSWSDVPAEDGRRIWLGWLNNWETCLVPTSPWRSCMSIPRELSLREVPDPSAEGGRRYKLIQRPVKELEKLRTGKIELDCRAATWPPVAVAKSGDLDDMCFVLKATLRPATARSCGFRIRTGDDEFTEIGYDRQPGTVYVDRRKSGVVDFHKAFPGRHEAPTRTIDGAVQLEIVVDRSSVEVFINDGEAVISDRIFPTGRTPVVEAFTGDGSAKIDDAALWPLKSIWKK